MRYSEKSALSENRNIMVSPLFVMIFELTLAYLICRARSRGLPAVGTESWKRNLALLG
jgi:hypothetical protein